MQQHSSCETAALLLLLSDQPCNSAAVRQQLQLFGEGDVDERLIDWDRLRLKPTLPARCLLLPSQEATTHPPRLLLDNCAIKSTEWGIRELD
jgi:hypothetical protein